MEKILSIRFLRSVFFYLFAFLPLTTEAQELQAKININHQQVQGTDASIFDNLQQTLEQFVNERQWTDLQFQDC